MKIVLDTNVLMSGLFWSGTPQKILLKWNEGAFSLSLSLEIIDEYRRVAKILSQKFKQIDVEPILDLIIQQSDVFAISASHKPMSRDADDDKFVLCAWASKTKYIVSGDRDLLEMPKQKGVTVLKPKEFLDLL